MTATITSQLYTIKLQNPPGASANNILMESATAPTGHVHEEERRAARYKD